MRSPVASVVAAAVLALVPAAARAQQPPADTVSQVLRVRVKEGVSVAQYEAGRKKHMAWHKSQNDPWTWNVYEVLTGPDTGGYIVVSPGHSWADLDTWQAKFGDGDTADAQASMSGMQGGSEMSYWTQLSGISRLPAADAPLSKYLTLTIFRTKPGNGPAFETAIGKINEALNAAKYPVNSIWYRLASGGQAPAFAVVTPRANLAALGLPSPAAAVAAHAGATQAAEIAKAIYDNVESITSELLQYRPDLGHAAPRK
jgi:hypothetical protein